MPMSSVESVDAAAVDDEDVILASAAKAKGKAKGRGRGRGRAAVCPRIDLDEEIAEANRLAVVSRKMLSAAKTSQKNNKKYKQRLIKKAGKLSADDLERIAVLKRCGLYGDDHGDSEGQSQDPSAGSSTTAPNPPQKVGKGTLRGTLASIDGCEQFLAQVGRGASAGVSAAAASGSSDAASAASSARPKNTSIELPRGSRLGPSSPLIEEEDMDNSGDQPEP